MNNNGITFDPMQTIQKTYKTEMEKMWQKLQKWDEEHSIPKPNPRDERKFSFEEIRKMLHEGFTMAEIKEMEAKK